ncbi:2-hydroxyacid dehydrogenase [Sulfuritalea hydrogenivorans]|uniref:2-hydroxyacid dehydrogenase n=1 Tax=Sulfuritalea hydrogenivorans TaxID=748811 RepID=UPI0018D2BEB3|nr:D-glycerate dehydrogenase [Sulfuritalea hydrogenivorans]MDK9714291.1 D-glycerate dehydrogenase [Sulfuritalea sp.]
MVKQKILVAREVFPEVLERLRQHFEVDDNQADAILGVEGLKVRLADKAGALTAATDPVTADVIAAAPALKAICNFAVGYNNIDLAACSRAGVMATNTPGVLDDTTADLAWALLMATARRLPAAERWLRNGEWQGWQFIQWLGSDVHHATLGILGMGRIGQAVARRALGFDMKVIYHNRTRLPADKEDACRARFVDRDTLLRESDFLVLLLPYSPESHHTIGAAELALMKPTAHLINVARGGIVDDEALISALRQRRLAGAGIDVFEGEPKYNPGFLELDNVALTPHIGSSSRATRMAMAMRAADNLIAALSGQRPPNLLNPEVMG